MRPSFRSADRYSRGRPRRRPAGPYRYVRMRWRLLFRCVDWLGWLAVRLARGLRERFGAPLPPEPAQPRSILLVQLDHLGDAIISTVMLPLLRSRYPAATIEVLASPWNQEVFLASPEVDRVHVSQVNRFARRRRYLWLPAMLWWAYRLRKRNYDLAVDIRGEFPLAMLIWLSGARRRVGWDCGGGGFLLTESPRWTPRRPEVESRLALLAELDIALPEGETERGPRIDPPDAARRNLLRRLAEVAVPGKPLFAIHLGAGTSAKRWPIDSWRSLVARLIADQGVQVAVLGGEEDRQLGAALAADFAAADVSDWTGNLRLDETAALIEQADLFVGADSGPAHLAAAVGTPAVVLFSGTNDSRQWRPFGPHVAVVRHEVACSPCHRTECFWADHPCMRGLSVPTVLSEIQRLWLDKSTQRHTRWSTDAFEMRPMSDKPQVSKQATLSGRVEYKAR